MTARSNLAALALALPLLAQDVKLNVTYVCNNERLYVESCNIRDLSDTSTCMVAHPDRPQRNGIMAYTTETRATLKKLLPTCTQPSAQELARADAFKKKQQELYDKATAQANPQPAPRAPQPQAASAVRPPKNAEERAMRRCVSSGRLPASCTGNALLGAFGQMLGQVLPGAADDAAKGPPAGPAMAGVYQGPGNWRLDFNDESVLVNCASLSPDEHHYTVDLKNSRITIDTTPKPLVLTVKPDGSLAAPGPLTINGVVATGPANSGYRTQAGVPLTNTEAANSQQPVYDRNGLRVSPNTITSSSTFAHRTATCPALNLTSKGNAVGIQTMQTDLLKTMFSGEKGPPTPPGIRMRGIFAASTGFSLQFFPESVILAVPSGP